ncbi:PREDICTED: uncharacterized protein LOC109176417 [Ipomoea nil]|uniref:uncharacterized protein LOC109176417 n=1 Tax=Ipomoea nil TaxID=35883 RepID=UPI000901576F|nr:PREDICTED: uncharacterized protein LOC109176417 [Ipomoea nil]
MSYLAQHWGAIDLYVEHEIDEAEVVPNLPLLEPEHAKHIQEDVEEVDLESNNEDGDSDLERSPQDGADFVDVECQNAENNDEDIGRGGAEGDTENVGEKDVQSQYYDSDDSRFYVCFAAVKKGFLEGCSKVIGLDGCFFKGMLKGEILSAVGRDANNQMYPIAWGIGLTRVIKELFPDAEHRNCARHVHANWSKLHRGKVLKKHFWMCAKTTNEPEFQEQMKCLGKMDPTTKVDLERYPPRFWCKAFFRTTVKWDAVDNNLSEAFNRTLVKARVKPVIPMLKDIRVGVMRKIAKKIKSVESWTGNYGPLIMKKLDTNIHESMGWKIDFNRDDGYEIKKGRQQFKVKLACRSCSCRAWDLYGVQCPHAICAIFDVGRERHEYIDPCYSKEAYLRTYVHALQPMNGELFWPRTQNEEILAPIP